MIAFVSSKQFPSVSLASFSNVVTGIEGLKPRGSHRLRQADSYAAPASRRPVQHHITLRSPRQHDREQRSTPGSRRMRERAVLLLQQLHRHRQAKPGTRPIGRR